MDQCPCPIPRVGQGQTLFESAAGGKVIRGEGLDLVVDAT